MIHISFSYKIAVESQIDSKASVFYNQYRMKEKSIALYHACYACMETHRCVIRDDMGEVYRHPAYEQAYQIGKEIK